MERRKKGYCGPALDPEQQLEFNDSTIASTEQAGEFKEP
jgi:hypothetical protein